MESISLESNGLLPGIILDKKSGTFKIYGKSCPENADEFFEPVFNWFDQYQKKPLKSTILDFSLTYFNTISAKIFYLIISKMEKLSDLGYDVKIRWFYPEGDDDVEEAGEEFEDIFKLKFEHIPVENNEIEGFDSESFFENLN